MRSPRHRAAKLAALAVVAAVLLAACGSGELSLSLKPGAVSDCYRGLPAARSAIHDEHAKLKGVHRITFDHVLRSLPGVTVPGTSLPVKGSSTEVCTFAFEGDFSAGQVTGAPPTAHGPVAVVVISSSDLKLLASYVGPALPSRFSRRVASPRLVDTDRNRNIGQSAEKGSGNGKTRDRGRRGGPPADPTHRLADSPLRS